MSAASKYQSFHGLPVFFRIVLCYTSHLTPPFVHGCTGGSRSKVEGYLEAAMRDVGCDETL